MARTRFSLLLLPCLIWTCSAVAIVSGRPVRADAATGPSAVQSEGHWAFQSIHRPDVPEVKQDPAPDGAQLDLQSPIDRFVVAKLEANGMRLSPPADRRTLIRRAYFDLLGLPPRAEEVEAFVHDAAPNAFPRLVDRLLASPHYGVRWGRHWLDVARYADTKGYVFSAETRYPYSYTYRDYVIRAFNDDLPYNRFILEQLAADQLDDHDEGALAALGFLTVGRRFRNNPNDVIDDRIDVVTRGLMGLTAACARCHDHKYDPIPSEDYYSLYGVFASCYEPDDLPLLGDPQKSAGYASYKQELDKRQAELDEFVTDGHRKLLDELRSGVTDYLLKVVEEPKPVDGEFNLSFGKGEPRPQIVQRWREYLQRTAQKPDAVFAPWQALVALPENEFSAKAPQLIAGFQQRVASPGAPDGLNRMVVAALAAEPPRSMSGVARVYGKLLTDVYRQSTSRQLRAGAPPTAGQGGEVGPSDPAAEQLRQVLYGTNSPTALTRDEAKRLFDRATKNKLRELQKQIDRWKVNSENAPPRAMVLYDKPEPVDPHVLIRGNPNRPGKRVPRQFLGVLAGDHRVPFVQGSGRLELAQAIVDPANPLTARVLVNRVWMRHFGRGLVETPDDFGTRSDPPSHPQLLDWLAWTFKTPVHEGGFGWSIKRLHRAIMLSAVYQQSSADNPLCRAKDPENRLLWRMNRRRLGFEAMRDSLLAVSGQLDASIGGRPVDLEMQPFPHRRTVYGFVNRNNLPGLFRMFDFANPDSCTARRPQTTVPQQALFALNSEFAVAQARALAALPDVAAHNEPQQRIQALYRRVYTRDPAPEEVSLGLEYIQSQQRRSAGNGTTLSPWEKYAQVLLLSNEFWFVD